MKLALRLLSLLAIIGLAALAFYAGRKSSWFSAPHQEEHSEVLLQQVKAACKLITAEGYFSEIYDYKDYYHWDIGLLRKKALIRVKARVSVGYNLEKMKIEALPDEKKLVLSSLPEVELLSIDHDLDYYDISEGHFNSFSASDYNKLQQKAKDYIRKVAMTSELVGQAEEQGREVVELIRSLAESAGWTLEIRPSGQLPIAG